jgi:CRISPR-associated protein Csm4
MPDYVVRIRPQSAFGTPLHSGTLFGHLCWAWRHREGEASLSRWLASLAEEPFLISDGMPRDRLPRPEMPPPRREGKPSLEEAERFRRAWRRRWIRRETFSKLRTALSARALLEALLDEEAEEETSESVRARWFRAHRAAHNTINRLTGRTPEERGLFFLDDLWPEEDCEAEVWVRCSLDRKRLEELFGTVGELGYGRDASTGRGRFAVAVEAAPEEMLEGEWPRRMSLSHGTLTENMEEPYYRLETHYGRLGSLWATGGDPFKFPLTLLAPGATFRPRDRGPYGELLGDVHPRNRQVRHNGWHLTVGYREA